DTAQEAPLFHQGGLTVVFPRTVRAAISVKTAMDNPAVKDSVEGLNSLRSVCQNDIDPSPVWCGGYFYEVGDAVQNDPALVVGFVRGAAAGQPVRPPFLAPDYPHLRAPDLLCSARQLVYRIEHGQRVDD